MFSVIYVHNIIRRWKKLITQHSNCLSSQVLWKKKKISEHISAAKSVHCNSSNRKHPTGGEKEQIHLILNSVRENVNAIYLIVNAF